MGLARRGDTRVIPAFLRELQSESPEKLKQWSLVVDGAEETARAAVETGDPVWLPLLAKQTQGASVDRRVTNPVWEARAGN